MKWHYFLHLTCWAVPVLGLQWIIGGRIFRRNLRAILMPPVVATIFFSLIDEVAVHAGIWFFDPAQVVGWWLGWLPVEEVLFFFLTALLVAQSFVLLLPDRLRH